MSDTSSNEPADPFTHERVAALAASARAFLAALHAVEDVMVATGYQFTPGLFPLANDAGRCALAAEQALVALGYGGGYPYENPAGRQVPPKLYTGIDLVRKALYGLRRGPEGFAETMPVAFIPPVITGVHGAKLRARLRAPVVNLRSLAPEIALIEQALRHLPPAEARDRPVDDKPPPRLTVDLARRTLTLDGEPYDVRSVAALRWVKVLADHPGEWIGSADLKKHDPDLEAPRTTRWRALLPEPIRSHIDSEPGRGSRLRLA
jgi:hypothetical protein